MLDSQNGAHSGYIAVNENMQLLCNALFYRYERIKEDLDLLNGVGQDSALDKKHLIILLPRAF